MSHPLEEFPRVPPAGEFVKELLHHAVEDLLIRSSPQDPEDLSPDYVLEDVAGMAGCKV